MFSGMKFNTFTLGNDLQVLAISDERFVKSSAAMAVMAGSMQNPNEHLGLAHFLEHMLFLGTEDYPNVGEYEDFLNKNGGGHNAYTSIDHTNYFFDVTHPGFEGALQRFSRFFVNPTFDEKYLEREKNAVHSEHEKNLKDDGRREYRFLQMMTDPNHPFSKFATGDKNTLSKASRDVVMDFYKNHYSSNLMRLVMMSPLSGDEMKALADKHFGDVPNLKLVMPKFDDTLFVNDTPQKHQVETVRDQDYLKISFDMPDEQPYWESKPVQFLAHLLGEEGEGSLLTYLKKRGWALGLETSTWWRMFHIKIHLTEEGKGHFEEIMEATFSYIKLIKNEGLKEYLYNERKVLAELDLKNLEPKSSMSRASQFSASMLYYPVDSFLSRHYLFHKYSKEDFEKFLGYLNTKNMQVSIFTKEKFNEKVEPFYGIGYRSDQLGEELIEKLDNVDVFLGLKYPEPNPYVPNNLELIEKNKVGEPQSELYEDYSRIFSQVDTELGIPKGSISLSFISDVINGNPENYLLAKMYASLKKEELNEWGYPVKLAGLNYSISHGYNTITLDVSGFSEHLGKLLQDLVVDSVNQRRINHVDVEKKTFEEIKKKMKKSILNKNHDAAYQQLLYETGIFFSTAAIHRDEYVKFIDEVTLEQVNVFARKFFSEVSIRTFSFGNVANDAVKPVIDSFFKEIKAVGFVEKEVEVFENKFILPPDKKMAYVVNGENNNNGQVTFYKLDEWSIKTQACVDVIAKLIEQPFFTELRTHQQLGYVVAGFSSTSHGFCGLGTLIQSQTHEALDCFNRAQTFLEQLFAKMKTDLKDEDVEAVKGALISELTQTPNSMGERLSRFTMMAGNYHGDFQFLDKLASEIKSLDATTLKNFIAEKIDFSSALTFLYNGSDSKDSEAPEGFEKIENYQEFTKSWVRHQPYKNSADM